MAVLEMYVNLYGPFIKYYQKDLDPPRKQQRSEHSCSYYATLRTEIWRYDEGGDTTSLIIYVIIWYES